MTKHGGPKPRRLVVAFVSFTLVLTLAGGAPGVLAKEDNGGAPRATGPDSSPRAEDPLQAPRGQDPQAPRDGIASSDEAGA